MFLKHRKLINSNEGKISIIQFIGFVFIIIGLLLIIISVFMPENISMADIPENFSKSNITSSSLIAVAFFITMLGFALAFPSLLEGNEGLSTMRIVIFMMVNVICMLLLKIGWTKDSLSEIGLNEWWMGVIAFIFGAKATQSYFESRLAVPKSEVPRVGTSAIEFSNAEIAKLAIEQNQQFLKVKFPNIVSISDAVNDLNKTESHVVAIYLKDNISNGIPDKLEVKMPDGSVRTIGTEIVTNVGIGKIQYSQLHTEVANSESSDYIGSICCAVKSRTNKDFIGVVSSAHIYTCGNYDDNYNGLLNAYQQKLVKFNGKDAGKWFIKIMNHNQDLGIIQIDKNQQMDADYMKFNNSFHLITDKDVRTIKPNVSLINRNGTQKEAYIIDYNVGVDIYYDNGPSYKKDIILLGSSPIREKSQTLTEGGDSGSCVYHKDTHSIIGMLLGGNDKFSFVLPIQQTFNSFNMEVI